MIDLLLVFNNYFHDLASGIFFGTAIVFWALAMSNERIEPDGPVARALNKTLWISLVWILVGGTVRAIFFPKYEFMPAIESGLTAALIAKHVMLFATVAVGLIGWRRARAALSSQ